MYMLSWQVTPPRRVASGAAAPPPPLIVTLMQTQHPQQGVQQELARHPGEHNLLGARYESVVMRSGDEHLGAAAALQRQLGSVSVLVLVGRV